MITSDIRANTVVGTTIRGNVDLSTYSAKTVYAKALNGNANIKVGYSEVRGTEVNQSDHGSASVSGSAFILAASSFKGRFLSKTYYGSSQVTSLNKEAVIYFGENIKNNRNGYVGEEPYISPGFANATAYKGNANVKFV